MSINARTVKKVKQKNYKSDKNRKIGQIKIGFENTTSLRPLAANTLLSRLTTYTFNIRVCNIELLSRSTRHTKNGKTSTGKQKFKCKNCSKTFNI